MNLTQEISPLRTELKTEFTALRTELKSEMASVRAELASMKSEIIKWVFAISFGQAAVIISAVKFFH